MYRGLKVVVVVPAHDEERLLPRTLGGLPGFVDAAVVVDDASGDGTAGVAVAHGAELVRHPVNQGVGGAIVTGYRRALHLGADAVVVVGADAQMDPAEMHRLLDALLAGADYAKGDRLGHPEVARRMPLVRLLGNLALTWMTRISSGYGDLSDSQCGYTAVRADVLTRLPLDELYPRYGFPNDLLAKLAEIEATVVNQPVSPIYGDERSGIRVLRVMGPIFWLLVRSGLRRVARQRRFRRAAAALPPA